MNAIPKIIHYCWFGGNELPQLALKCIESWKKYCPDYKIIQWNENNFSIAANDYIKEAYETKKWAFVTDYVRLIVLNEYGGIYMDTDIEIIQNIDKFLVNDAFSGFEQDNTIQTGILGAKQGNEWIKSLISYYDNRHFIKKDNSLDTKTNVFTVTNITQKKYNLKLNNTLQKINGYVTLYPKDYFCPKDYDNGQIIITGNTHAIHHFSGSWHTEEEKAQYEIYKNYARLFGNTLGQKIFIFQFHLNILKTKGAIFCIKKLINRAINKK